MIEKGRKGKREKIKPLHGALHGGIYKDRAEINSAHNFPPIGGMLSQL
jgi:hypothetical protein